VIKIKELKDGEVRFFNDSAYVKARPSEYCTYHVYHGDILFALTGDPVSKNNPLSWTGRVAKYRGIETCLLNQRVCKAQLNEDRIVKDYLFYYFRVFENYYLLAAKATGSASQANISTKTIGDTDFPLPPLPIQQSIAATLSCLDDKIELNNKINANLEAQAQAIFKNWFESMESDSWNTGRLADIAYFNPQRTLRQQENATYLEMSNLPTQGCFPLDWTKRPYAGGMKFRNGDTLLARITPCLENGKAAYVNFLDDNETAYGSTEYIVLAPKPDYPGEMLYFLVRDQAFRNYAIKNMTGSTGRQRVSGEALGKYEMLIPPVKFVMDYASFFKTVMMTIRQNSLQNHTLSIIRDSLLPKLMSGEVGIYSKSQQSL